MIELSLTQWFWALFFFLVGIGLFAAMVSILVRWSQARYHERAHLTCRLCRLRYHDAESTELSSCPNCGAINHRRGQDVLTK